ncbi:MAG TPA: type ISP restriction/modification enzyme, partial [Terriglobia bacterium]|nr:type ISP restriction/modification enzyme [Terriglobia bacterium]
MALAPIDAYRKQIEKELQAGNATEHTHRPALKDLIESLASGVIATNEPKQVECGAPDFIVSRKAPHGPVTVGHIEAKDVGKPLDEIEKSDQLKRYLPALPNLILTDYLEFRWYVNGDHRHTARIARVAKSGTLTPEKDGAQTVTDLLTAFLSHEAQAVNNPKDLALRMARLTHFIRDMIVAAFGGAGVSSVTNHGQDAHATASAILRDLHKAFEKALIPDLPIPQFADMFAQTLAYGLFAARVNHHGPKGSFRRLGAASEIPKTNPFLRQLFETITGTALDEEPYAGFVDDLAQLLADTDIDAVLADFGKRTARQDPVVHFYETFLTAYDPKLRESRGVYYTPEPVVSYLVRSVDYLLKTRFGCANGLADTATIEYETEETRGTGVSPVGSHGQDAHGTQGQRGVSPVEHHGPAGHATHGQDARATKKGTSPRVLILDPACGTGTFLYTVIDHIRDEFMRQGNAGMWSGYVRNHLLPRIFGFELLMAPYAVAHLKLGMQLAGHDLTPAQREKWAYDFSGDERLGVFLTNTLEEAEQKAETLFGPLRVITQEGNAAAKIKSELPILAVIGNPPYSGHSANRSWEIRNGKKEPTFIGRLIQHYYKVDGKSLGERNPKWLQDDYVKFIRWGQWRIERTGAGILAFITNHGYLDNPTFRGMRQSLMNAFTEIYILNLHGNSKKKEKCPDGSSDENVFDIQQGVTLGIFVKEPGKAGPARVFHADMWGQREGKYRRLFETDVETTPWQQLEPQSPFYLFIPQEKGLKAEYERGWKITDAMPVNVLGFQSHRDHFAVDFDEAILRARIEDLRRESKSVEELRALYKLSDNRDWQLSVARKQVRADEEWEQHFIVCLYRPFDWRPCYFSTVAMDYPRRELLDHVARKDNLCLNTMRQTKMGSWQHAVVSDSPAPAVCVEVKDGSNLFPLYLYPKSDETVGGQTELRIQIAHWPAGKDGRRPNLNPKFVADLEKRLGLKFVPDGRGDICGTGVPPVTNHGQDAHATHGKIDMPPVGQHGPEGHPTHAQDAHATIRIRYGAYLPHWTHEGATYAVCFRLADSLPESVVETWRFERNDIVKTAKQMNRPLSAHEQERLDQLFSERVEKFLDEARGECWMQRDEVAAVVAGALRHFDSQRYRLVAWCVMPNHVHAVLQPLPGYDLAGIIHSWKSFSSKEANRVLGRSGEFWQPEYYDHLIRDEQDFVRQVEYVLTNPQRAGLENWKWVGSGTGVSPVGSHGQDAHATHAQDAHATSFGPEDIFNYIYAVFHSPTYRTRYAEFLKSDFPRVPLTSDVTLFRSLCGLGAELVALHLLESPKLAKPIARFPVKGSNLVDKGFPKYLAPGEPEPGTGKPIKEGRVYINRGTGVPPVGSHGQDAHATTIHGQDARATGQYFEGVPPEVWNFHIGGYQVCEKWLKDR